MKKPFISILLPAYNEEALVADSVNIIINYLKTKDDKFSWEVILIDDGSTDETGKIVDSLAQVNPSIIVIHHKINMNLGRALQTGFKNAHGDIIVVLDIDLSYSVDHIEKMVEKQIETDADIVIASPYSKGGIVSGVPFKRAILSRIVNKFIQIVASEKIHTFTGMVRAYKSEFIKNLNLKTINYEINPEILYKALIMRARIREIPAHLDWSFQNGKKGKRKSSNRLLKSFFSFLMAAFIFRPYFFFISFGLFLLMISSYVIIWVLINTIHEMQSIVIDPVFFDDKFSKALGIVYNMRPHAFFIGGITLILAIQILSLGFMSLQKKRYFEELFHINSTISNQIKTLENLKNK